MLPQFCCHKIVSIKHAFRFFILKKKKYFERQDRNIKHFKDVF